MREATVRHWRVLEKTAVTDAGCLARRIRIIVDAELHLVVPGVIKPTEKVRQENDVVAAVGLEEQFAYGAPAHALVLQGDTLVTCWDIVASDVVVEGKCSMGRVELGDCGHGERHDGAS